MNLICAEQNTGIFYIIGIFMFSNLFDFETFPKNVHETLNEIKFSIHT